MRRRRFVGLASAALLFVSCAPEQAPEPQTTGSERAARRAFDGAPPTVPHDDFRIDCLSCHGVAGLEVPGVGFAPASPHAIEASAGVMARCRQCHVHAADSGLFAGSTFVGLRQDLRRGQRLHPFAPPVMPHQAFMRENCLACHSGEGAREEIRTSHPERTRCRQCHVERLAIDTFAAGAS